MEAARGQGCRRPGMQMPELENASRKLNRNERKTENENERMGNWKRRRLALMKSDKMDRHRNAKTNRNNARLSKANERAVSDQFCAEISTTFGPPNEFPTAYFRRWRWSLLPPLAG